MKNRRGNLDILLGFGAGILSFLYSYQIQRSTAAANRQLVGILNYLEGTNQAEFAAWTAYFAANAGLLPQDGSLSTMNFDQTRNIASDSSCADPATCALSYSQTTDSDAANFLFRRMSGDNLTRRAYTNRWCGYSAFPPSKQVQQVCLGPNTLDFTILASANGAIFGVSHNPVTLTTAMIPSALPPEPSSITIKNLNTTKKSYLNADLCLFGPCTTSNVEDVGTDGLGEDFYLTAAGGIVRFSDLTQVALDPRIASIDYQGSHWLLLLTDGSVMTASDIADQTTYVSIPTLFLPAAYKIIGGPGP